MKKDEFQELSLNDKIIKLESAILQKSNNTLSKDELFLIMETLNLMDLFDTQINIRVISKEDVLKKAFTVKSVKKYYEMSNKEGYTETKEQLITVLGINSFGYIAEIKKQYEKFGCSFEKVISKSTKEFDRDQIKNGWNVAVKRLFSESVIYDKDGNRVPPTVADERWQLIMFLNN